ncbi:MAG: hypothetical protein IIY94_02575 [Oscillospiraceae bacterium]|nr:hypothetical protein [Oscillospiraceae bacterium]
MNENNNFGFEQADSYVIPAKKPKKRTGLFIGLGCLLVALLAVGGWWLLNHMGNDPLKDLKATASKSIDSYLDYVKDLPNLHSYTENMIDFYKSNKKHMNVSVKLEGVEDTGDMSFQLSGDRDAKGKKLALHGSYSGNGMEIPVDLYFDKEQIQIGSSTLLNKDEAFALPVQDFGKKWNASQLSELAETSLPEELSLSFLVEGLSEQSMQDTFGTDWTDFVNSVSYRKATEADGPSYFTGKGDIYVLSWDQSLLNKIGAQADSIGNSISQTMQMNKLLPAAAVTALYEMSQVVEAPKFLVADGMLTGVVLQEKTEAEDKGIYRIELVGESNPWARCVMDSCRWDAAAQKLETLETMEYTMTVADGKLQMKGVQRSSEGGEETVILDATYNDADGSMTMSFESTELQLPDTFSDAAITNIPEGIMDANMTDSISYRYLPIDNGVRVEMELGLGAFTGASVDGSAKITMDLSTDTEAIQPMSKEPTQLLDLNQTSLSLLAMRIYSNISGESPLGGN